MRNKLNLSEYSHICLLCLWDTNWVQVTTLTSSVSVCKKQTESDWILSHLPSLLVRNKLSPEWLLSHLPSLLVRNKLSLSEYSHIFLLCLWETNWVLSEYSHIFRLCLWETNWIWVNTLTSAFYACEIQTESKWLLSHLPSLFVRNKLSPEWILSHLPSMLVRNKLNLSEYSHIFLLCLWETNWI